MYVYIYVFHLQIASRLKKRFRNYIQVLQTNKATVQNMYRFHVKNPMNSNISCCMIPHQEFMYVNYQSIVLWVMSILIFIYKDLNLDMNLEMFCLLLLHLISLSEREREIKRDQQRHPKPM